MADYGLQQATRAMGYGAGAPSTAPKEIGFLQRIEGVNTGLMEVCSRLESLEGRILCQPSPAHDRAQSQASGLPACLSEIENRVRETLVMIGRLESSF